MKTINPINLSITLTEWPAAFTICFGITVISGVVVFLGAKLIENGYEITPEGGLTAAQHDDDFTKLTEQPKGVPCFA